ncbi:disease resistance protein RPM1-like [Carya illinoinensis]|uniref:disease resistance protein RPM1-like n=1 Tax=Carya illinoinensis TaxID=32201 RepID=UPI001C71F111|nr:disease resistance protein RPM1-like [Carya illinoinensis]
MAEIAVNYVLDKLTAMLQDEIQLHRGVKDEAQMIADELERIKAFLRDADEIEDRSHEAVAWVKLVREVANDIEDALDEYNLRVTRPPGDDLLASLRNITPSIKKIIARHQIATEIQRIKFRVLSIAEGHDRFRPENPMADIKIAPKTWDTRRQDALLLEEADLVGIEIPKKELIGWLLQGDTEREVVSVVGMGGLGKTTLVKKVYDDAEVKLQFKYRAWITVSTSFNMEELLKDLVRQLYKVKRKPVPQEVEGMNEAQLRTKINSFLQQKKYLIVLDDVWHIGDWDAVKLAFPKNSSSRVMLTTRHAEVASASCMDFNGDVTKVYPLNPLSPEESWTLFCRKTFEKNTCAPDSNWKALADSILGRCEGLPLAIVAISGVLATKSIAEWDMIQRSLADGLEENDRLKSINKILSLSYYDLPYYLKSCFLYLSIFPDYHPIDKMRLIRLWIAEGFVKAKEGMTLEEVAEAYFDELLNRSLIQVAGTTGEGRIKTCRIHDLLREIIIRKSSDQNFLTIVRENVMLPEKARRLSIQKSMQDVHDKQRMSRLRSLLMFRRVDSQSKSYYPILHPLDLKLLKVLDLEGAPLEIFPNEIFRLIHLKYLSLRSTKIKIIPSSIGNLQNLETFDLKNTCVTALPAEISRLQKLRHLLVYRYEVQSYAHINSKYGFKATAHITCLQSLQKLCFIEADHGGNDIMKELGCLTQLRRLGIVKFRTENGVALCSSIDKLENLRALSITSIEEDEIINLDCLSCPPRFLQRLYLSGKLEKFPHWISSLHSLAKVSLKWSQLRDDPLKSLQDLPNLAQLEFLQVYEGETLHFKAEGFQKLKILSLDKMDGLKTVIVDVGAMPLLEKLILQRCKLLHSLPSGIEHLRKLKLLEFWDMPAELIMTIRLDIEGGDYWKVEHVPEINTNYWRDGGWDVYSLYRSIDSENPAPTRSLELPSYWK